MKLAKDRLYYSISDVAEILNLKPSIIRFWETEFIILKPLQKEKNSKRKFKIREIEILFKIKTLLYVDKFTIKGASDQLKNWKPEMSFAELYQALENGAIQSSYNDHKSDILSESIERIAIENSSKSEMPISSINQQNSKQIISEIRQLLNKIR